MNQMQDKGIDDLFNKKLSSFEVKPSAKIWASISKEVNTDTSTKRKKPFAWIMAAASLVVMLGLGLLFVKPLNTAKQKEKISRLNLKPKIKKNVIPDKGLALAKNSTGTESGMVTERLSDKAISKQIVDKEQVSSSNQESLPEQIEKLTPVYAQVAEEVNLESNLNTIIVADQTIATVDVVLPEQHPAVKEKQSRNRKIHSVGDLVNFVVEKVDKRDNKVIEFKNDDENGSIISGFNLGLFQIKTSNK